ncbi:MAG: isoleucine--tRNA ligase [Planctomycetales bacterium]|nr:isoleucine--tRNA ligase [Planctomycetales bacterium]
MFRPVENNVSFPQQEMQILQFWKENGIYEQSLAQREGARPFVFYEGPPTANGMPHPGHCLTRAIKDLFPRYRTMRGYRCERKAGWDTHGLPVEVEVCKDLGIHSKEEIEAYGVEPFIQQCQQSVWRYMQEWERLTERLGFWIHLDEAYVTYHQSYVESVWWSLANLFNRGLLYEGYKIVWWWAQGGTALSSGEVGLGYREVADPSVYVKFPLLNDDGNTTDTSLLVWTTTPWTLPSNQFAAVHPELDYATVVDPEDGEKLIVAAALVDAIAAKVKRELTVESTCKGADLIGKRYVPPFDYYYKQSGSAAGTLRAGVAQSVAWRVVAADFVTIDSGSGVVHQAPAFGEVDYDVLIAEQARFADGQGPELINAVGPDGKFTADAPDYQGRWVKDCDKDIARNLRERGLLFHQEQYLHEYPFCWRAEQDPLIQYPRKSWFIRTTQFKDAMLANNAEINWLPEHIQGGRFGNFLESNVDWALSRERYWGTPLPIWVCESTGRMEAIGSYAELLAKPGAAGMEVWSAAKAKNPALPDDLCVHKPYIDAVTYNSPFAAGARMRRVPEVIDCWYDSGAMPFAQWGWPHQNDDKFSGQFPADFISEALDQTRGWFYSLLAISTLLFSENGDEATPSTPHSALPTPHSPLPFPHPYRTCIVLGLMLGEDGQKMSKSKRNYREPREIFDKYGADALRWYFFANQPPWTSIRYSEQAIKESIPKFLLTLWNCYSFFVIYANSEDHFDPAERIDGDVGELNQDALAKGRGYRPPSERRELDRWILSELNRTCIAVVERMDAYDNFGACKLLDALVDNLSNWYVRRSRPRFWSAEYESADKLDAYWTLYECLTTTCKLVAPFTPFVAEAMWQNLAGVFGERATASVHLCDYPSGDADAVDQTLSEQMELGRLVVSLGREARAKAKIKVRQPLEKVEVILANPQHQGWLESHRDVVAEELNVKHVEFTDEPDKYIHHEIVPNFKLLGPKIGKLMPKVKQWLTQQTGAELLANLRDNGKLDIDIDGQAVQLSPEEVEVRITAREGWTAANDRGCVVVLSTELTPELIGEGYARDLVRLVNDLRKEIGCQFIDRIELAVVAEAAELLAAVRDNAAYIQSETQADKLLDKPIAGVDGAAREVGDLPVQIFIRVKK